MYDVLLFVIVISYGSVFLVCNDPATTEIYPYCPSLSLHGALPMSRESRRRRARRPAPGVHWRRNRRSSKGCPRATVRAVLHKASWVSAKGSHKVQPKA